MLRGSSFYEDFVKTVLTSTPAGRDLPDGGGACRRAGRRGFPDPAAVLDYGEERLRERAKLGFRARTVIAATRRMLDDGAISASGEGSPERLAHDYLLGLKGIGPYAAAHCRVLLHDFSRIPVDSSVIAYLRERHGCDPAAFAADRSSWGVYLALGYRLIRLREKLQAVGRELQVRCAIGRRARSSPSAQAGTILGEGVRMKCPAAGRPAQSRGWRARSRSIRGSCPMPRLSADQASTTPGNGDRVVG